MGRKAKWHSVLSDRYHNNKKCPEGNNIEHGNRRADHGNKKLCRRCKVLASPAPRP